LLFFKYILKELKVGRTFENLSKFVNN
jgi:hypothetical protein